jgi:WD40 repeat protein
MRYHCKAASLDPRMACRALALVLVNLVAGLAFGQEATITTVAGNGVRTNSPDGGLATDVGLNDPWDICFDAAGHMYIVSTHGQRVRRVDKDTGVLTTVAGTTAFGGSGTFSGDGGPATDAGLSDPRGAVIDEAGTMYIVDTNNHRIRKVDGVTGLITTVAGSGLRSFSGDGGPATEAGFSAPHRIALGPSGNLYIADLIHHRIRKLDLSSGIISTIAGDGVPDQSDPGPGASLYLPLGLDVDSSGNVYVANSGDHRVRRVDAVTGQITTVSGDGMAGHTGDGGPASDARLNHPFDVCVDGIGNLYILCSGDHRVRRVDGQTGIITTVAGNGTNGYSGDGGPATNASLATPKGIAVDAVGDLYIADTDNDRIRKVHFIQPAPDIVIDGDLAYVLGDQIHVRDFLGTFSTQLTASGISSHDPAWSPDGERIAFKTSRDGNTEVYVMNADGSAQTRLTDNPAEDDNPCWSPEGNRILFMSNRSGQWQLYVMNEDGSDQYQITTGPDSKTFPEWSPDGSRILYHSGGDGVTGMGIFVANADGSGQTRLTSHGAGTFDGFQDWSPDGSQIVFQSNRDGDTNVYKMNLCLATFRTPA